MAEVILAIEYLHNTLDIVYRDLKPENILVMSNGHIKLTDFGLSKDKGLSNTMVGTLDYLAPEIINYKKHNRAVDLWCLGCLTFELLAGFPPFFS